jgi:hypothetical protein
MLQPMILKKKKENQVRRLLSPLEATGAKGSAPPNRGNTARRTLAISPQPYHMEIVHAHF